MFPKESHKQKRLTGGAVVVSIRAEQTFSITIPEDFYDNPSPYDIEEAITLFFVK